jgi:Tectonin domain
MRNLSGTSLVKILALALSIACTQSASAQHFKRVNVTGGRRLVQIVSGGASVWARASNGNPYIFKAGTFVLANSISLTQIAVGGGNAVKRDTVWGLDSSGRVYRATPTGTSWVFSQVPGVLDFIAVGIGYQEACHPYEVWGLNTAAQIYRYSFCSKSFEQVPGTLGSLAVGGGDIWGINGNGDVYWFNFDTLSFDPQFVPIWSLVQVTVGQNQVWGLTPDSQAAYCDNASCNTGQQKLTLTLIQAGGDGIWAIGSAEQVYRYEPATGTAVSLVQMPGALSPAEVYRRSQRSCLRIGKLIEDRRRFANATSPSLPRHAS